MADTEPTLASTDVVPDDMDPAPVSAAAKSEDGSTPDTNPALESETAGGDDLDAMEVQPDVADDGGEDMLLEEGDNNLGKRVKVYELRDQAWFDRGTGHCKGVYDDQNDLALLVVEPEEPQLDGRPSEEAEGAGGFFKDDLLLNARVTKEDQYSRQQETLIVWTDQATQLDIALSFQDPSGCEDIWQFISEVQKHLNHQLGDDSKLGMASSSPMANSPILTSSAAMGAVARDHWQHPSLANIKEHEVWLRMQAKSAAGRERAVEHIIGEDYIKQLIVVLNQAEDLESVSDLHALCSLMQTILMFNDNGIFEYILQDDIFMGVLGMLEYDPEFPTLKASYRAFFRQYSKYRQVVEIKDDSVRNKIHQTSRLLYLKDVVLARMLDDPTFNILNSFVFFNQVDIITYIQTDEVLLHELFSEFQRDPDEPGQDDAKRRDLVMFLHQLMIMGKGMQVPNRLALYRTLVDRGLLFACEWAFQQREATILHGGAEILTIAVEHDVNAVRLHVLREEEMKRRTLVMEIIVLLQTTQDQGLIQQTVETLKTLLEPGAENEQSFARAKELPVVDTFTQYFYDSCAPQLFLPISNLPEMKEVTKPHTLTPEEASLLTTLVDLLSYCVAVHGHRAQYYILSNPLAQKVCTLVYAREKTLRHSALRFIKACLRTGNHFIHRSFMKNGVTKAILDLVERETVRDTMLSSACLDTLELIRKDNTKTIIMDMFEKHDALLTRLTERPIVRAYVLGLRLRWEQFKEPPPRPPPQVVAEEDVKRTAADEEEAYFNQSDDDDETNADGAVPHLPIKRKRAQQTGPSPKRLSSGGTGGGGSALGLDYDDASDSDGSAGGESPKSRPVAAPSAETESELVEGLSDVEHKVRAKRIRNEEEEEGSAFAQLMSGGGKAAAGKEVGSEGAAVKVVHEGAEGVGGGAGKDKKIKLSLGSLGRKFRGGKV